MLGKRSLFGTLVWKGKQAREEEKTLAWLNGMIYGMLFSPAPHYKIIFMQSPVLKKFNIAASRAVSVMAL